MTSNETFIEILIERMLGMVHKLDPYDLVLGAMKPEAMAAKLREMGDDDDAAEVMQLATPEVVRALEETAVGREPNGDMPSFYWPWETKPYQHTNHIYGYIQELDSVKGYAPISSVSSIQPDPELKGTPIIISLDRLRVADYPGTGTHLVLFQFGARHQTKEKSEQVTFSGTYRAREGESAGVKGYPIFVGLQVGNDGLAFECSTVNVKNESDDQVLAFMESAEFKEGLKLIAGFHPAIAPLSKLAVGLTSTVAKHNRNVKVQEFFLGLDFGDAPSGARLREGTYVAMQAPQMRWDWSKWVYDPGSDDIVFVDDPDRPVPFNYLLFRIRRHDG